MLKLEVLHVMSKMKFTIYICHKIKTTWMSFDVNSSDKWFKCQNGLIDIIDNWSSMLQQKLKFDQEVFTLCNVKIISYVPEQMERKRKWKPLLSTLLVRPVSCPVLERRWENGPVSLDTRYHVGEFLSSRSAGIYGVFEKLKIL